MGNLSAMTASSATGTTHRTARRLSLRRARPGDVVAAEDAVISGFATVGPARDPSSGGCGELYALYVRPDRWRHGIGGTLLVYALARLTAAGFTEAILWVLEGNERARRFYRAEGWLPDGAHRRDELTGVAIETIRYRRRLA